MKKVTAVLLIMCLAFSLCSCSREEPEAVVSAFFDGLKAKDEEALARYMNNEDINALLNSKGRDEDLDKIYTSLFDNLSYKIQSTEEVSTDDRAEQECKVKVQVTNADFEKVKASYDDKAFDYMIDNLYSRKMGKKQLEAKCLKIFAKEVEKAGKKEANREKEVTLTLTANEFRSWDLTVSEELMDAVMGGLELQY